MTETARHGRVATTSRAASPSRLAAVAAGIAAVLLGAGVGELVAALIAPTSSPFAVVGGALIDLAPAWAKDTAIAWFGTNDKTALLIGIGIVLLAVAAVAGLCEARWRHAGVIVLLVMGAGVGILSFTRPDAGLLSWLPSVLAGAVAAVAVRMLIGLAPAAADARIDAAVASVPTSSEPRASGPIAAEGTAEGTAEGAATGPTRRRFLIWAGGTAVVGVAMAFAGSLARAGSTVVTAARAAIRLPKPATPASAIPAGAELDVPGLSPLVTPNDGFYRIDTALIVPTVDPSTWRLRVHGMVANEVELTWDELLALPLMETAVTLSCVSNPVGGDLVGNAVWLGYPIRELLARAQPDADADMVLSTSVDGFTAGTPLEALTDDRDALLAIGMNGEPLPLEHGFPVRMVVPGLYGYVSATKWVTELEVTRFDRARAYWTDRGWSARGPIKLQSRIDVPRTGANVSAGDVVIAGVAWQPGSGVAGVEVQVDDGPWRSAELASAISDDTWVQWRIPWRAESGEHVLRCRALSADGKPQTEASAPPAPDGATGWHAVSITAS
ncbi:molybdopterin-dependent oxidoreductase [Microbacterium sp. H1-D42]|uniref:molybdopterin-dependent oxidoreductase n=1 Tax=Microbacterium sp. H1-D42 TaxID=2925844 RepID=UPI001F53BE8F|nr:molybdopterin-dependent oxidoreductase [Microbacterium sp. H1-D42]UNK71337.1 molybdopterin-dependent oxidoreductase [Microbacterium sp. H1-D42]